MTQVREPTERKADAGETEVEDEPRPTLLWSWLRVRRAWTHIGELTELYGDFWEKSGDAVQYFWHPTDDETGDLEVVISRGHNPPTRHISVLVGEIAYNLRCALDYLAHELSLLDSGTLNAKSQFPIDEKADTFWKQRRGTWLKGISQAHVNMISEYQPFKGCVWTRVLRDVNNMDKHRSVAVVVPEWSTAPMSFTEEHLEAVPGDPSKFRVKTSTTPELHFDNNEPVIQWMQRISEQVAFLLLRFQADFGERATFTLERGDDRPVRYGPGPNDSEVLFDDRAG